MNCILTYQDTRLAPQCYAFHLVIILHIINFTEIKVGFEESMYVVHEGGDSIAPVLELSKPLDCCAIIRAKLEMDGIGMQSVYHITDMYNFWI